MKKLRAELEIDATKARKKVEESVSASGGVGASSAIETASPAADRASRQVRQLGEAADGAKINLKSAGKAFAGMAVGLAASYAAKRMGEGRARTATEYGAGAVQGAAAGMMFGPWGAALGAAGGLAKTYLDRSGAKEDATKDFQKYEDRYQESRLQDKQLRDLTEIEPPAVGLSKSEAAEARIKTLDERIAKSKELSTKLFDEENALVEKINSALKKGHLAEAESLREELETKRAMRERTEAIERSFAKERKEVERHEEERKASQEDPRATLTGTDALSRVGGGMGVSGETKEDVEKTGVGVGGGIGGGGQRNVHTPQTPQTLQTLQTLQTNITATPSAQAAGFSVPARQVMEYRFDGTKSAEAARTEKAIRAGTEAAREMNKTLLEVMKQIEANTKGGETWQ